MQLTKEEKDELFLEFQERFLLSMPDIIGNLITQHMNNMKIKEAVLSKDPDFKKHPKLVASGLLNTEGNNPLLSQEEIVEKAVPLIKKLIADSKSLDMKDIPKVPDTGTHGEL
jgi:hypothetical protein